VASKLKGLMEQAGFVDVTEGIERLGSTQPVIVDADHRAGPRESLVWERRN
jgi:hypothetical protein